MPKDFGREDDKQTTLEDRERYGMVLMHCRHKAQCLVFLLRVVDTSVNCVGAAMAVRAAVSAAPPAVLIDVPRDDLLEHTINQRTMTPEHELGEPAASSTPRG